MSDDGSEIDSKYNIHLSFIIVVRFKSDVDVRIIFRSLSQTIFVQIRNTTYNWQVDIR